MRLTDNEKRDIVRLIQEGKPLPDKFRFLLFDQDREVELVWNGKSNRVENTVHIKRFLSQKSTFILE